MTDVNLFLFTRIKVIIIIIMTDLIIHGSAPTAFLARRLRALDKRLSFSLTHSTSLSFSRVAPLTLPSLVQRQLS